MLRSILFLIIFATATLMSCKKEETTQTESGILPTKFRVDIPNSISKESQSRYAKGDTLNGNEIYGHLGTFILVGKTASILTESIIFHIAYYKINKAMSLSYTSDDDGRVKNLVVVENISHEGKDWEYQLTITDALSEGNTDGGVGMQIFWNKSPIKGISILKPKNINAKDTHAGEAMYRIDYNEDGEHGYDASMIVSISDLPMPGPLANQYAMKSLKMFVGKKGNNVDVYGNSDHPNAKFFTDDTGFDWAFVASCKNKEDVSVAEVGIPNDELDSNDRKVILEDNAVGKVFEKQIYELWPNIDQATVDAYLHNTAAPGFFNKHGFIQGGTAPNSEYDVLISRIKTLTPYNPKDISTLKLEFK